MILKKDLMCTNRRDLLASQVKTIAFPLAIPVRSSAMKNIKDRRMLFNHPARWSKGLADQISPVNTAWTIAQELRVHELGYGSFLSVLRCVDSLAKKRGINKCR